MKIAKAPEMNPGEASVAEVEKKIEQSIQQINSTDEAEEPAKSIADVLDSNLVLAQNTVAAPRRNGAATRLRIPNELPGAEAPVVTLPPQDTEDAESRAKDIEKYFAELPAVAPNQVDPYDEQRVYSLEELQAMALSSNPVMAQAEANIVAMRGNAIQSGLAPNPIVGFQADTVGSNANANYIGGFVAQKIKTAGKLGLAESRGNVDVFNAELMQKKTRVDLITRVRGAYFAALIARENVRITEALVRFTDNVYHVQLDQLRGGLVSVYEPIQLRALAFQARTALVQSRNRYDAAWRQLAATVGMPNLEIGELEGSPEMGTPVVNYDVALPYILANHTDVLAAQNSISQARINLRLQEVTPIPDLDLYVALQKDHTTAPIYRMTYNVQAGLPIPIFDANQGNIMNAQATLIKNSQETARVQNELAAALAGAIERYANASNVIQLYRDHVLPDQARAYRGVYERHQQQPDIVGFADVVNAQQMLLMSIGTYINTLGVRWQAFTEIGELIQAETLEGIEAVVRGGHIAMESTHVEEVPPANVPPEPTDSTEK
ncbi:MULTISPECIES: TolC family protein [unclassified Schlesneria]|uniref:TolC family protein n=1 Tax=unclassified Schlesneria TaxID=2762017 RepID=UPI002EE34D22